MEISLGGISRIVAVEVSCATSDVKVRHVELRDARFFEDGEGHTICPVYSVISCVVEPLGVTGIIGGLKESAAFGGGEVGGNRSSNSHLISVLHIGTNARSVENHRNVQSFEFGGGADSGELQKLWGVEYSSGEDDLASSIE